MNLLRRIFPNHRRRGDIARSQKDWPEAEAQYLHHLAGHPHDTAIWVQLGHALKEQQEFERAAEAYGRARTLTIEDDYDLATHYAFALGKGEHRQAARDILFEAYAIKPDAGLRGQIIQLDERDDVGCEVKGEGAIFFSVHDMLGYLKEFPTMSGIQRVQAGVALHAIFDGSIASYFIMNSLTGSRDTLAAGEFWLLDNDDLRGIIEYASAAKVEHPQLRKLIFAAEERARRVRPGKGNVVVLLGAFWGLENSVQAFVPCWHAGATIGAYIYDLIPISHPQYCDPGLVRDFTMCFSEICAIADFFLTISDFTRFVVKDFLAANGLPDIPSATVPLAHSLTGVSNAKPTLPEKLVKKLNGRKFVAYVSTVEGRKNHLYVVKAWMDMMKAGIAVPDLVFVGRAGWKVDDLFELLEKTEFLDGHLHIVHNITDGELNAIYEECLFTVFTSHVEGWGLPVGESLVHGTPCIASHSSSIPEVGGDFVDYVDPDDLGSAVALFSKAIEDPAFLRERRDRILREFRPRTWDMVGADFVGKVGDFAGRIHIGDRALRARIPYAAVMRFNELAQPTEDLASYIHNPWRLLLSSFYQPEPMGVWMRGTFGEFLLETGLPEGTEIDLHLNLASAPWGQNIDLQISADVQAVDSRGGYDHGSAVWPLPGAQLFRRFDFAELRFSGGRLLCIRVGPRGLCALHFSVQGEYTSVAHDPREFVLGLVDIGFVKSDDLEGRLKLAESRFTRPLAPALL